MNGELAHLSPAWSSWRDAPMLQEERRLAGRLGAALYLLGAVCALAMLALPGIPARHWSVVLVVASAAAAWAALAWWRVDWESVPNWAMYVPGAMGLPATAAVIAATGGADSPARFYLFFIVVLAGYFYRPPVAALFFAACAVVHALPLAYQPHAADRGFLAELLIVVSTYFVLGSGIAAGKLLLVRLRDRAEQLAAEQGALRRVATAVAGERDPAAVYALVAEEAARLLNASGSGILRFSGSDQAEVMGSWSREAAGRYQPGTVVAVRERSDLEEVLRAGHAVRVDRHPADSPVARLGYACSLVAPVHVGREVWGALAVASDQPTGLPEDAEQRLSAFGELLATAIGNTEARAVLAAQASSDALTGLANHRAFHERLGAEVARATRYSRTLALVLIDIDNFKEINDTLGHEAGDRVLGELAGRLMEAARAEDLLARIGGDEFGWLMPETDRFRALAAAERARQRVSAKPFTAGRLTISAGICDVSFADEPSELFHLADGALYWSKVHGRDVCWVYDPEVVSELSSGERAEHLARSQALLGLRALARAIDAKDPSTRQHSGRVADMAARLGEISGWSPADVALLREAALVHDVGKIGVPDAILLKPGPLTPEEYEEVRLHAARSAEIVEGVLKPRQVAWIRAHHERPDGRGYPAGLRDEEIPEGAALLAVADAWDVMTASRPYSERRSIDEALAECRRQSGKQFAPAAVEALASLMAQSAPALAQADRSDGPGRSQLTTPGR